MEALDEQMMKLKLPNRQYSASGHTSSGNLLAEQQQTVAAAQSADQQQHQQAAPKPNGPSVSLFKVGPLVPPKPVKKKTTPAAITTYNTNNNNNTKTITETLYESASDRSANAKTPPCGARPPDNVIVAGGRPAMLLQRKQPIYGSNGYNDLGLGTKVTLDNPVILDQQLEALAHHKKQLEKKGLLQQQQQLQTSIVSQQQQQQLPSSINDGGNNRSHLTEIPKLSSTSLVKDLQSANNVIYTNLSGGAAVAQQQQQQQQQQQHQHQPIGMFQQQRDCVYTNIPANMPGQHALQQQQHRPQLYTNVTYQQNVGDVLEDARNVAPAKSNAKQLQQQQLANSDGYLSLYAPANNAITAMHLKDIPSGASLVELHNDVDDDDELPPPPSPVSSSYSELRRATTNNANGASLFNAAGTTAQATATHAAAVATQNHSNSTSNIATGGAQQQQRQSPKQQQAQLENCEQHHYLLDKNSAANAKQLQASGGGGQTYTNMNYNSDYNTYCPTLQSLSQSSTDYYGYGSFSQGTSTYESIYEPINPRPSSQLSLTRSSNSLMYASGYLHDHQLHAANGAEGGGGLAATGAASAVAVNNNSNAAAYTHQHQQQQQQQQQQQKEAEVEALTDFLVHSMHNHDDEDDVCSSSTHDTESYGICYKCQRRILGETSGCTAMDQTYHIACFTCSQCQTNLQGKPFYALDGKPYCEYDYLQTLEKCSVCQKPILERILRATGKPYHPQCFTCVVCHKSLDGIPFTVDATNQNYCIIDFHKKFAPRCCVCKEPIMPAAGEEETVRVVALDRSFHFECYKCEDCGLLLSSEAEGRGCYPLDDHVLCKSCNANRVQMLTSRMTTEL